MVMAALISPNTITYAFLAFFTLNLMIITCLCAPAAPSISSVDDEQQIINDNHPALGTTKSNMQFANREKLRRGLSSFVNQLNPAPFFVPAVSAQQLEAMQLKVGADENLAKHLIAKSQMSGNGNSQVSSSDVAAIVNNDSTASALPIKKSNKVTYTRAVGGPLRWGRR